MVRNGKGYSERDIAYMRSLSAAVVQRSPRYMITIIILLAIIVVSFIAWMNWAEIDVVVRGSGKVNPSSQLQVIQSLEGGIVDEIYVREGDEVEVGMSLIKISDISFSSSFSENQIRFLELKGKIARLVAESENLPFVGDTEVAEIMPQINQAEIELYESNKQQLQEMQKILDETVKQQQSNLLEAESKQKQLERNFQLLEEELEIKKPLVKSKLISEVEFLQLKQRHSDALGELEGIRLSIPKIKSAINEAKRKRKQSELEFRNLAKKELNELQAEVSRIKETQTAIADRVKRTTLRSPVKGTISRIHISTVGGVLNPGEDIVEIVPNDDLLLVEVEIKPADIAYISIGQTARIKFSAYDFAIYGSLAGKVSFISADTVTDEEGISSYIVRIKPDKSYLGHEKQQLPIRVGMTCDVDILTDKKTILQYLLKPIYRGLNNAMGER